MKKIIIIITSILTVLMITSFVILKIKGNKVAKALSIKEIHNFAIGNKERKISQILYFNNDNIFNNKDIISSVYLSNETEDKILQLKLNNVKKTGYTHSYNNTKYNSYSYELTVPVISNDFEIDDCYIIINSNDKSFKINIGCLSIKYDSKLGDETISLNAMEGRCIYKPYQTLSYVNIELLNKEYSNVVINSINMGKYIDLVTDVSNELIMNSNNTVINSTIIGYLKEKYTLYLSYKENYVLKSSYLIINYTDDAGCHNQLIDIFNFYDNGYQLPEDNKLIYEIKI